jgi:hypothetical protein
MSTWKLWFSRFGMWLLLSLFVCQQSQALSVKFITGIWLNNMDAKIVPFGTSYWDGLPTCVLDVKDGPDDEEVIHLQEFNEYWWTAGPFSGNGPSTTIYTGEEPSENTITKRGNYTMAFGGRTKYCIQKYVNSELVTYGPYTVELEPADGYTLSRNFDVIEVMNISAEGKTSTREQWPSGSETWQDNEIITVNFAEGTNYVIDLTMHISPDILPSEELNSVLHWNIQGDDYVSFNSAGNDVRRSILSIDKSGVYSVSGNCGVRSRYILILANVNLTVFVSP